MKSADSRVLEENWPISSGIRHSNVHKSGALATKEKKSMPQNNCGENRPSIKATMGRLLCDSRRVKFVH